MTVITAPDLWEGLIHKGDLDPSIFLAGGITNCPDWQSEVIDDVSRLHFGYSLLNPRRPNFPIDDPTASEQQIRWERLHLDHADAIVFWFPKETLCPIVLFELGAALYSTNEDFPLFIGCDPEYARKQDVEIQTGLVRPKQKIHASLDDLSKDVRYWIANTHSPF